MTAPFTTPKMTTQKLDGGNYLRNKSSPSELKSQLVGSFLYGMVALALLLRNPDPCPLILFTLRFLTICSQPKGGDRWLC